MKAQTNYQTCHVVWTLVFTILQLKPHWPCDSFLKQFPNMLLVMVHSQQQSSVEPMLHVRRCDIFFGDEIPLLCASLTDKTRISVVWIFHSWLQSKRVGVCCLKSLWSAVLWHLCCWGCPDAAFYLKSSHIGFISLWLINLDLEAVFGWNRSLDAAENLVAMDTALYIVPLHPGASRSHVHM